MGNIAGAELKRRRKETTFWRSVFRIELRRTTKSAVKRHDTVMATEEILIYAAKTSNIQDDRDFGGGTKSALATHSPPIEN